MDTQEIVETFKRSTARAMRSDFGRDHATDAEREALAKAETPIEEPLAQDYASWRYCVLLVASVALVVAALIQLIGFETVSDGTVRGQIASVEAQGGLADEDAIRLNLERNFGSGNLDVLDAIPIISLLAILGVAFLAIQATRGWRDVARSAKLARWGWYALIGTPLLLAILPWSRMLDFGHLPEQSRRAMQSALGVALGLTMFMTLAPKLLSIFPGIIRASVTLKSMLHESPVPGYAVVLFAPVYAMFVLVVFTTVNQMQGSYVLLLGLACLIVAPLIYLVRAREFLRPHTSEESATLVRSVRKQSFLFNLAGLVLLVVFLADMDGVSWLRIIEFFIMAAGGLLLTMVVAADVVIGLLRLEHAQAKLFVGSELATAFETKLSTLTDTGCGEVIAGKRKKRDDAAEGAA